MCLSSHVAPLHQEHEVLGWGPPRTDGRIGVIEWTCHCDRLAYELCRSGGLYFIRRYAGATCSSDTDRVNWSEAQRQWEALLRGRTR